MRAQLSHRPACLRAKLTRGFTVIELMVVVAVVSILMVIALPTYFSYATRSKVAEAMGFMAEAKTSVSEYFYSNHSYPANNAAAGLQDPDDYDTYDFIARLEVSNTPTAGTIAVTLDIPNSPADRKLLLLVPRTNTYEELIWTCMPAPAPNGVGSRYLPANCRN